jgi:integrase
VQVPELETSVFLVPSEHVKNREERLVVLNRVAQSVVDEVRGQHEAFVFTYRGKPIFQMNNTAWQRARKVIGLSQLRVHDLKHTFGRRLRSAGVPLETRKVLLGHRNGDITTHYAAPELEELIEAANKVSTGHSGKSPALVVLRQKMKNRQTG